MKAIAIDKAVLINILLSLLVIFATVFMSIAMPR